MGKFEHFSEVPVRSEKSERNKLPFERRRKAGWAACLEMVQRKQHDCSLAVTQKPAAISAPQPDSLAEVSRYTESGNSTASSAHAHRGPFPPTEWALLWPDPLRQILRPRQK
ncbi:hypothetical protein MHYP_G00228040 [Metynnis hypsauchen]